MFNKIFIAIAILIMPCVSFAATQADNIESLTINWLEPQKSFKGGQVAKVKFQIINQSKSEEHFIIESGYESAVIAKPFIESREVTLKAGQKYLGEINAGKVSEAFEPGTLKYYVKLKSVEGLAISEFQRLVDIKTTPTLPVMVDFGNKKVYRLGESVNINVSVAGVKQSIVKAVITIQQNGKAIATKKALQYKWMPKSVGNYKLVISAVANNYKAYYQEVDLIVIEKAVIVKSIKEFRKDQLDKKSNQTVKPLSPVKVTTIEDQVIYLMTEINQQSSGKSLNSEQLIFIESPRMYLMRYGFEVSKKKLLLK